MHKEPHKPKGRITEKLYSQSVHPIYDTVSSLGLIISKEVTKPSMANLGGKRKGKLWESSSQGS